MAISATVLAFALLMSLVWIFKLRKEIELLKIDPLTGLYRRNARTEEEIKSHLLEAERNGWIAAVMLFDLNNLKPINDTLGHEAGDKALKKASSTIKGCLRGYDLIYRWGGDEFVAVITFNAKGANNPLLAIKMLRDRIDKCLESQETENAYPLSISCGISEIIAKDFRSALERADAEMYQRKKARKNR